MCPSCQLVSGWSSMEKFFPRTSKLTKEREKLKDLFVKSKPKITSVVKPANATCISKLEMDDVVNVMETLQLQMIPYSTLAMFAVLCEIQAKELYFPLKDVNGVVVGYKRLYKIGSDVAEQTLPDTESFGVVKSQTAKKDFASAILVLSIVDMLALATQKINCKFWKFLHFFRFKLISNQQQLSSHFSYNNLSSAWIETTTSTMSSRFGIV